MVGPFNPFTKYQKSSDWFVLIQITSSTNKLHLPSPFFLLNKLRHPKVGVTILITYLCDQWLLQQPLHFLPWLTSANPASDVWTCALPRVWVPSVPLLSEQRSQKCFNCSESSQSYRVSVTFHPIWCLTLCKKDPHELLQQVENLRSPAHVNNKQ